jgi:hypothetical protein
MRTDEALILACALDWHDGNPSKSRYSNRRHSKVFLADAQRNTRRGYSKDLHPLEREVLRIVHDQRAWQHEVREACRALKQWAEG